MSETRSRDLTRVNPPELGSPSGFAHGLIVPPGSQLLLIAGQTAADADGRIIDVAFAAQFEAALLRVLTIVGAAGGDAEHLGRITVYVTDLDAYRAARPALRDIWKRHIGTHYPAVTLVEVSRLLEVDAVVEIEATAVLPSP